MVWGNYHPDYNVRTGYHVVDIQLAFGPFVDDVDYITDYSTKSVYNGRECHQYRSLEDQISHTELTELRSTITTILSELAANTEAFILFAQGYEFKDDPDFSKGEFGYPEEYYCIKTCCDYMNINGSINIFETRLETLAIYEKMFCEYDRVKGLAIKEGQMAEILNRLSLRHPEPSTRKKSFSRNLESLYKLLEKGEFFFEEIDNGTRLRITSKSLSPEVIQSKLDTINAQLKKETNA